MSSFPPPDVAYDLPQPIRVDDVFITIVGIIQSEPEVEVLARSGDEFYRFCLPKSSRVIREFWKNIGVTNVSKLPEGAYQDERGGCGPYTMSGILIGEDLPIEEPTSDDEGEDVEEVPLDIADAPMMEPGRLDNLLLRLAEPAPAVEEEAPAAEEEVPEVVSVGTKVLISVKMESVTEKPATSSIIQVGGGGIVAPRRLG
jgi:hypothetical protein